MSLTQLSIIESVFIGNNVKLVLTDDIIKFQNGRIAIDIAIKIECRCGYMPSQCI